MTLKTKFLLNLTEIVMNYDYEPILIKLSMKDKIKRAHLKFKK